MTEAEMVKLLGRSLTPVEVTNFDLYLDIATMTLEDLLCTPLEPVNETRVFDTRKGYSTAFVDIFNDVETVLVDGEEVEAANYSKRQWDRRNGSWYNSLVFDDKFEENGEIEVTADWGFIAGSGDESDWPVDLQNVLSAVFDLVTKQNKLDREISSKKVEDFTITYNHSTITMKETLLENLRRDFSATLSKYKLCDIVNVQQGKLNDE